MPLAASLFGGILALGCATTPSGPFHCPKPPPFHLTLQGGERLNPDPDGQPLPTVSFVFQLESLSRLENADFMDLWQRPAEVLGPDLLKMDELLVEPSNLTEAWLTRDPKAQFVVVMGLFRQPAGNFWRGVIPLSPVGQKECPQEAVAARSGPPYREDLQLRFQLQDYRVEPVELLQPRGAR